MRRTSEHRKTYKRRLYTALLRSTIAAAGFPELSVQNLWPNMDWECICKKPEWCPRARKYEVIHDIIPTDLRLHRIKMIHSDTCRRWTATDTLERRLIACVEGRTIWQYTKNPSCKDDANDACPHTRWLDAPSSNIWPPKRRRAILRVMVNLLDPELFFLDLAHPVYKMPIIQEPITIE